MQVKSASDIAALIRDRRAQNSLTQAALAHRVGVSRAWIVQLEKGKSTAQLGLALRVLKELGVVLDAAPHAAHPRGAPAVDLGKLLDRTQSQAND
jgi:HTH-type transcriptional regulator / antitoxin HipB